MRLAATGLAGVAALALTALPAAQAAGSGSSVGLNVVLNTDLTSAIVSELSGYGTVNEQYPEIDGLTMRVPSSAVSRVARLPYVEAAGQDVPMFGGPVEPSPFDSTADGIATWNTDMIDVYENGEDGTDDRRVVASTGSGVYVAVLDTGLHSSWPHYFGAERIATEHAIAFGGGGGERGTVNTQPHKWGQDQNGHGTHVTSTILGYNLDGIPVGGVAPDATVIPVKVLNQNGSGWSSVITAGINHVTDLVRDDALNGAPVVINMSLGGPAEDPLMTEAIDAAIAEGILVVAAAGNSGPGGPMDYPGAQAQVISVAAAGWTEQWMGDTWFTNDVAEPTPASQVFILPYSSRAGGRDLDVAAPGAYVLGPYQTDGRIGYSFLTGTSMATPHVAGALALMLEASPGLGQTQAEEALEASALPLPAGEAAVITYPGAEPRPVTWRSDATGAGLLDVDAALAHLEGASVTSARGGNSSQGKSRK